MIVWLWANVLLTVFALSFVRLNSNAPHRLRFFVCFFAMSCWLIPWELLSRLAPTPAVSIEFLPSPMAMTIAAQSPLPGIPDTGDSTASSFAVTPELLLILATVIGLLLFVYSCYRYAHFIRRLSNDSTSGEHLWSELELPTSERAIKRPGLRIQRELPGGLTTGLLVPTIWIHEDLLTSPNLRAVLVHEYAHARRHDNAYLWMITFLQRVFWWNPLVHTLGYQARRLQELSCDQACKSQVTGYRDMLNRLIVTLSTNRKRRDLCAQAPGVLGYKNFNVQRIRALEKRYVMRIQHYASMAILLFLSAFALSWATAQEGAQDEVVSDEAPVPTKPPEFTTVDEAIAALGEEGLEIPGLDPDITLEEANEAYRSMSLYAHLLDRQYDAQEAEIIRLNNELAELRNSIAEETVRDIERVPGPDRVLQLVVRPDPIYPQRAFQRGLEGYVIVEHAVTPTGTTADLVVVESSSSLFDRAAIEAVQKYEYLPATEDELPVAVTGVRSRVEFQIDD